MLNVVIGQYIPQKSLLHRADPRTKIISLFLLFFLLFFLNNLPAYLILSLFSFTVIKLSKIPGRVVLQSLKPILWFILFTFIFNIFLTKGEVLFSFGPFEVSREGISRGIIYSWRLFLFILFSGLLTWTTSPLDIAAGLETLFSPAKKLQLPVHETVMMLTIALRFIPTLLEETEKIMKAQMARGMDFTEGSLFNRVKNILPLLVPLFVSVFQRADDLAVAMEARCYRGDKGRTRMKQLIFQELDLFVILAVVLVAFLTWFSNSLFNWSI